MYCPCSENKGADQLRGYLEADLRLCFRICRLLVFSQGGLFNRGIHFVVAIMLHNNIVNFKIDRWFMQIYHI